jgi:hypothetical protein
MSEDDFDPEMAEYLEERARLERANAAFNLLRRDRDNHDPYLLLAAVVWPETDELREMVTA